MIRQEYHSSYTPIDADDFKAAPFNVLDVVSEKGLAIIDPEERINGAYIEQIGRHLGTVMLAPRESVRKIAYNGRVVPIVAAKASHEDDTQQVFSASGMGLHIDESGRTPAEHPSHIVLGCVVPPQRHEGGDTVFTFNQPIFDALTPDQQELLAHSRQRFSLGDGWTSKSTFISEHNGRKYFSLWDGGKYGSDWSLEIPDGASERDAHHAISTFFEAALDPKNMHTIPWEPNRVVVADNRSLLHGRTPQRTRLKGFCCKPKLRLKTSHTVGLLTDYLPALVVLSDHKQGAVL